MVLELWPCKIFPTWQKPKSWGIPAIVPGGETEQGPRASDPDPFLVRSLGTTWQLGGWDSTEGDGWLTRLPWVNIPKDVEKPTISQGTWSKQLINRRVTIWWTGVILIVVTLIAVNGGFIVVIHDERNEECSATCILLDILVQGYSSDWRTWFQAANWPIPISSTFFVLGVPDPQRVWTKTLYWWRCWLKLGLMLSGFVPMQLGFISWHLPLPRGSFLPSPWRETVPELPKHLGG